jgi:hypothetical protein
VCRQLLQLLPLLTIRPMLCSSGDMVLLDCCSENPETCPSVVMLYSLMLASTYEHKQKLATVEWNVYFSRY